MHEVGESTLAVHGGDEAVLEGVPDAPIVQSNAFTFRDAAHAVACFEGAADGLIYTRWGNPTVAAFERKVAALEGAEAAVALSSGMGAVHGALMACLRAGDHVIAPRSVYAETAKLLRDYLPRLGIEHTFVDLTHAEELERAWRPETRAVWIETPANPTLDVTDIAEVARMAEGRGAVSIVDSTFATPYHQRPLSLGATLVVHAATKALGGHGDALGGVVLGPADRIEAIRAGAVRALGNVMAPFTAWLLSRGVRTLALRAQRSSATALELATRLEHDPRITAVHYPGLASHPGHAVAARQMRNGYGAQLAVEVRGGQEAGRRVYDAVRIVARAVSLGDVRTLLTHAASTTHASMPPEARRAAGITDGLMRLSVGIEDVEDLWRDLDAALPSG